MTCFRCFTTRELQEIIRASHQRKFQCLRFKSSLIFTYSLSPMAPNIVIKYVFYNSSLSKYSCYMTDKVLKNESSKICGRKAFTSNFLKAVFHKFYLAHSWTLCLMYVFDNFCDLYCMLKFLDCGHKHLPLEFERWICMHTAATTKIHWNSCSLPDSKGRSTQLPLWSIDTPT